MNECEIVANVAVSVDMSFALAGIAFSIGACAGAVLWYLLSKHYD